jgi:nucleoside-diphosphate-sugar epimerase
MHKGKTGQRYIFSTQFLTVDALLGIYEEITGRPRPRLRLPPPLMAAIAEVTSAVLTHCFPQVPQRFTPGAVRLLRLQRRADCSKAQHELGYQPTSIVEAVRQAYEFFVQQGQIRRPQRLVGQMSATPASVQQSQSGARL